jgi:hypothetical protein
MAALTPTELVQRVLENVDRIVGDTQCPDAAIQRKSDDEYRRLRRRLSSEFPTIYEKKSGNLVVTTGSTVAKPTDCEAIRVFEKSTGAAWYPLQVSSSLNREIPAALSFYEIGANLQIMPESQAAGTYRLFYTEAPPAVITTYEVPDGLEGIIIEKVSAWARQRHNEMEHVNYHLTMAKTIWDEQYMALWNRYGSHGQSGMNLTG